MPTYLFQHTAHMSDTTDAKTTLSALQLGDWKKPSTVY